MLSIIIIRGLSALFMLSLAIYQAFSPNIYSEKTIFKYLVEFFAVMGAYFYFCHMSERWQRCNDRVRRAVGKSYWYMCSPRVQRNLIMMLVRSGNTREYIGAYGAGVFQASYRYYISSLKLSYSFLNFVNLSTKNT